MYLPKHVRHAESAADWQHVLQLSHMRFCPCPPLLQPTCMLHFLQVVARNLTPISLQMKINRWDSGCCYISQQAPTLGECSAECAETYEAVGTPDWKTSCSVTGWVQVAI